MTIIQAIILGATEGFSEFLPISSSGHLLIVRRLLGLPLEGSLSYDAILQCATLIAVILYFWKDIVSLMVAGFNVVRGKAIEQKQKVYLWAITLGTIPGVVFGLLLEKRMDTTFRSVELVAYTLILGSILMWFAERAYSKRAVHKDLTITSGVGIGFFQTLALLPGVSRSGSTISGGFLLGLNREEATKFSFLLALPILAGSGLKKLLELDFGASGALSGHLFIASLAALGAAIISIHFLINFLKTNSLKPFIWYRIVLACVLLLFL